MEKITTQSGSGPVGFLILREVDDKKGEDFFKNCYKKQRPMGGSPWVLNTKNP
jgi:hypothetical protein